jgi:hypothetical protein
MAKSYLRAPTRDGKSKEERRKKRGKAVGLTKNEGRVWLVPAGQVKEICRLTKLVT